MVGHGEKFCEKVFETPLDKIEKPYGVWMKAEPRRKNHTIGAKWLRQGGRTPTTFRPEKGMESSSTANPMKGASGDNGSGNSGITEDMEITNKGDGRGVDKGGNIAHDKTVMSGINLNIGERETLDLTESTGLLFMEQKRRRVEEPNITGPIGNNNSADLKMTDTHNNTKEDPKNELKVGAAMQTRQSL